jgi:hypothetical protein
MTDLVETAGAVCNNTGCGVTDAPVNGMTHVVRGSTAPAVLSVHAARVTHSHWVQRRYQVSSACAWQACLSHTVPIVSIYKSNAVYQRAGTPQWYRRACSAVIYVVAAGGSKARRTQYVVDPGLVRILLADSGQVTLGRRILSLVSL